MKTKSFKFLSLVKFNKPPYLAKHKFEYPFKDKEVLLFLGEIPQMPSHCAVVNKEGKVFWGYHTDNFERVKEEDA